MTRSTACGRALSATTAGRCRDSGQTSHRPSGRAPRSGAAGRSGGRHPTRRSPGLPICRLDGAGRASATLTANLPTGPGRTRPADHGGATGARARPPTRRQPARADAYPASQRRPSGLAHRTSGWPVGGHRAVRGSRCRRRVRAQPWLVLARGGAGRVGVATRTRCCNRLCAFNGTDKGKNAKEIDCRRASSA